MTIPALGRFALAATTVAFALGAAGCSSFARASGASKTTPDEFRIVTKAPLTVPPEFNLRPPRAGEPRPEDLLPRDLANSPLYGGGPLNTDASDGEQMLLARVGAASADPAVRALVDIETAGVVRKDRGFANRILFWRDGDTALDETTLADAEEIQRRQELADRATGGEPVVIRRDVGPKLPGL